MNMTGIVTGRNLAFYPVVSLWNDKVGFNNTRLAVIRIVFGMACMFVVNRIVLFAAFHNHTRNPAMVMMRCNNQHQHH